MIQDERFLKIIDYLRTNQTATLAEIAALNSVSVDTVRRDLAKLETGGMLKRVRGGAVFHNADISTQHVEMRGISHRNEKKELAALLGAFVVDGQTIALNSGTTCAEVANYLAQNYYRLTVLTNNLQAIDILARVNTFTIIVPGGIFDPREEAIFGESCESDIRSYNIDTAILGVHAVSLEKGITDFRLNQAGIIHAMMQASRKRIVVADSSKFEKIACMNICGLDEIDMIVSDSKFPAHLREAFTQQNITLITSA